MVFRFLCLIASPRAGGGRGGTVYAFFWCFLEAAALCRRGTHQTHMASVGSRPAATTETSVNPGKILAGPGDATTPVGVQARLAAQLAPHVHVRVLVDPGTPGQEAAFKAELAGLDCRGGCPNISCNCFDIILDDSLHRDVTPARFRRYHRPCDPARCGVYTWHTAGRSTARADLRASGGAVSKLGTFVRYHPVKHCDVWTRDTGPIWMRKGGPNPAVMMVKPVFTLWGCKCGFHRCWERVAGKLPS